MPASSPCSWTSFSSSRSLHVRAASARKASIRLTSTSGTLPGLVWTMKRPGALEGALRFQAQHRDLAHAAAVRGRGEEAEEAVLADQVSVRVVALDPDAVERHGAMDQTAAVRLGDDEEVFRPCVIAELGAE